MNSQCLTNLVIKMKRTKNNVIEKRQRDERQEQKD